MFKQILRWLACVIGVVFLLVVLAFYFPWDDRIIDDADLALSEQLVADANNIYIALPRLNDLTDEETAALEEVVSSRYNYSDESLIAARAELVTLQPLTVQVIKALDRRLFACPDLEQCELDHMRDLILLLIRQGQYQQEIGNNGNAQRFYEYAIQLGGAMMAQPRPQMIDQLVGFVPYGVLSRMYKDGEIDAVTYANALNVAPPEHRLLVTGIKADYQWQKEALLKVWGADRSTYWQQSKQTVNDMADITRLQIMATEEDCAGEGEAGKQLHELVMNYQENTLSLSSVLSQNLMGRAAISAQIASFNDLSGQVCEVERLYSDAVASQK